jgi:hypothetical protein
MDLLDTVAGLKQDLAAMADEIKCKTSFPGRSRNCERSIANHPIVFPRCCWLANLFDGFEICTESLGYGCRQSEICNPHKNRHMFEP